MILLADIAHGHTTAADVLLLIAAIVFVIEFVLDYVGHVEPKIRLHLAGFGLLALALLVLF